MSGEGESYVVINGWLCEVANEHTCGVGKNDPVHEPNCGMEPIAKVEDLLRSAALRAAGRSTEQLVELKDGGQEKPSRCKWCAHAAHFPAACTKDAAPLHPGYECNCCGDGDMRPDVLAALAAAPVGGQRSPVAVTPPPEAEPSDDGYFDLELPADTRTAVRYVAAEMGYEVEIDEDRDEPLFMFRRAAAVSGESGEQEATR